MLGQYNISLSKFFKLSSCLCVDIIATISPISFAISSAFVFYQFKQSNQLIAMQSSGMSPLILLRPLMILATSVAAYLYASNAYISPNAWNFFRQIEFEIKNNIDPPENSGSIFSINGFSAYAGEYAGNYSFRNLFVLNLKEPGKTLSYYAKKGSIKNSILLMEDGECIETNNLTEKNSITRFKVYRYDLREILKIEKKAPRPNEKYMMELLADNEENVNTVTERIALFHQKITSPILVFIFSLMSFLLILMAPHNKREKKYLRIFIFVTLLIVFQGVYFWVTNAAAKDLAFIKFVYALVSIPTLTLSALIFHKNNR